MWDRPRRRVPPWAHEPDLAPGRRHHRVGHARGRRQGEGAAGRRGATSSASAPASPTSRRRAHIVEAAVAACRDPRNHHYTPDAGPARAAGRDRGQDRPRLRATSSTPQQVARHQRRQARGLQHVPGAARPRRRGARCPRRTGRPTPRRSRSPTACPSCCPPPRGDGFRVTVEQLEAARTPRTKALLFVSPSNPTGAVYPPAEVEAIGRWARRARHLGRSPTRSTSTSPTATTSSRRCRRSSPSSPTRASCSTASPRPTR